TQDDCFHVIPDVWLGQRVNYEQEYADGQIDYLDGNGQVGKVSWYIPKRTAKKYPFMGNYLGLSDNRELLAEIFHRPVSWRDYCHQVSATNCSEPDEVALRYPETEELGNKYFCSGVYIGHFRPTDKNNCTIVDANATSITAIESNLTCTGHIVNAKCSWSTFAESQAYWNNVALESNGPDFINGGYAYDDIVDIWRAANATNSDVISYFFEPDFASEEFRNTAYEYTKVILPAATVQCRDSRVPPSDRCSVDPMIRRGVDEGSCDDNAHATKTVVAMSLRDSTMETSDAYQSPAYAFIRNFNMDELELSQLLRVFSARGQTGHAAREVVCEWVGNNMGYIHSFIPPSHPRVVKARSTQGAVDILCIAVGAFAVVYVLVATMQMYKQRKMKVFRYSQVTFIFVVLFGLFLVAIGSILYVIEPSNFVCTAQIWLVAMGYTCMLVPLIIKVSAMNQLMRASARMRRIRIKTESLYAKVLGWLIFVALYMIVWTAIDPPRPIEIRTLEEDRTVIDIEMGCRSSSQHWVVIYLAWEMILALAAFVLAFQSRKAKAEFNESKSLGFMIYSHLGFAALRIVVFNVFDDDDTQLEAQGTSIFLSVDVILAVTIYLLPKFYNCKEFEMKRQSGERGLQGSATVREIQMQAESSSFQKLKRNSIQMLFGAPKHLTNEPLDASDRRADDSSDGNSNLVPELDNSQRTQEKEPNIRIEKAKEPTILEEENECSRFDEMGSSSTMGKSPTSREFRPRSGELRHRSSGLHRSGSNRSSFSSGGGSRTSLRKSISQYGKTTVGLLFGPTTELEIIQSMGDFSDLNLEDSQSEDLERILEERNFCAVVEGAAGSSTNKSQESTGALSKECGESSSSVKRKKQNTMAA
ncbi:MAG: hypothetical protein SGBAC_004421, partial [Bacillariaceae sp.]